MSIKTKIALTVALALGATSAALAQANIHDHVAPKQMTAPATSAFASAAVRNNARTRLEPPGAMIQDQLYHSSSGLGFVPFR
jgi:hypothetical protein